MIKKNLSKIISVVIMSIIVLGPASIVNAKTVNTDFGTMTYSLTKSNNSSNYKKAVAKTSMPSDSKVFSYIKTTLEIQKNSTGSKLLEGNAMDTYNKGKTTNAKVESKYYDVTELAAFSCHEVVGKGSHEEYLAEVF
jgi:hypothetical protein